MSIDELIAALETAEWGSRGLDGRVAYVFGWRFNGFGEHNDGIHAIDDPDFNEWDQFGGSWHKPGDRFIQSNERWDAAACERWTDPKRYTISVDAALRLMDDVLQDEWSIELYINEQGRFSLVKLGRSYPTNKTVYGEHNNSSAIAICIAILKAYKENL